MASPMLLKVAPLVVMMCMVLLTTTTPIANAALSCGQMQLTVAPCVTYLRNPGPTVPGPCCNGLRTLYTLLPTVPERRAGCKCLKSTVLTIPGLNLPALAAVPGKCGIKVSYRITPTIDCNTVN